MASIQWIGRAKAVAQVSTITIGGTVAATDTFTATINAKNVTFTAVTTSVADACTGLAAALNATTAPTEHGELTWEATATTVVGTGDVAGVPHTISVSKTGAANTIAIATTTAATGPNHWDNDDNWDGGAAPADNDYVYIANSNQSILYGWPSNVALDRLHVLESFTGRIGLPITNALGYREYRDLSGPSSFTAADVKINAASAGAITLPTLAANATVEILGGSVLNWASPSSVTIDVRGGSLTHGRQGEEGAAAASAIRVSPTGSLVIDGEATVTTLTNAGVTESQASSNATVYCRGGTCRLNKNPTTLHVYDGIAVLNGGDTVTTATVGPGLIELGEDTSPFAITNLTIRRGGEVNDPLERISGTTTLTWETSNLRG